MLEHNDLYKRYKTDRKREPSDSYRRSSSDNEPVATDEISMLYRQYRQHREPDFEDSIAMVMKVAREKIETENAVKDIVSAATISSGVADEAVANQSSQTGLLTSILTAPGRALDSVKSALTESGSMKWANVAVPVVAATVIAIGVFGYIGTDRNGMLEQGGSFDLAFIDSSDLSRAATVSEYMSGSDATSLGFTGVVNDKVRAFYVGVHSVDLQVAVLAKKQGLIGNVTDRLQGLLVEGQNIEVKNGLISLAGNADASAGDTLPVLKGLQESQGTFQPWYDWGRSVQSVHYSAQLALDKGITGPLEASIEDFTEQFQQLGEAGLSEPEIAISREIISLVGQSDFKADQLRSARNGARDVIALRRQSAP